MFKHWILFSTLISLMTSSAATAGEKAVEKPVAAPVAKTVATPAAKTAATPVVKPVAAPVAKTVATPVAAPAGTPFAKTVSTSSSVTKAEKRKKGAIKRQSRYMAKLKKSGVTVVYPSYVPARFTLDRVKVDIADPKHPDYEIRFRARKHSSFTIASAFSGIGDGPDGSRAISGQSNVFGPFKIQVFKPNSEGNNTSEVYYLSDWMSLRKKQSKDRVRNYHFYGTGVKDSEAISIVKSLAPIK